MGDSTIFTIGPKAVKKEITVWNVEEVRQFLKYAKKSGRYYIAFLLAVTTGMRQGEYRDFFGNIWI
ncbi:hypothetical protein COL78_28650 [Bacillus wiedmannii]|nr:hypothetical protein COL78_28650 [Bacillus wiedmannii]